MSWIADDIEQWRAILKYDHVEISPMAREAFLSALDEIERLRERRYVPPTIDPTHLLRGDCCEHVAVQHGYQFSFEDGSILVGGACTECDCPQFTQNIPPRDWAVRAAAGLGKP